MHRQEIIHLMNCLLDPESHFHEVETVANQATSLHEQICLAVWNKQWRENMSPAMLAEIIDYTMSDED